MAGRYALGVSYCFLVEIDGLHVGGFSEVSGLQAETEVEEYSEGGVNGYTHRFPKKTKFPPLVLKRGMANTPDLWNWYRGVQIGQVIRRNGSVILLNASREEVCRWNFFGAYPVRWQGADLSAQRSEVAIESIELVHNGFQVKHK